jgi:hypothetical protein
LGELLSHLLSLLHPEAATWESCFLICCPCCILKLRVLIIISSPRPFH